MNQMIQLKLWAGIDPDQRKFERLWFMIWIESDAGEPDVSRFKFVWAVHKSDWEHTGHCSKLVYTKQFEN